MLRPAICIKRQCRDSYLTITVLFSLLLLMSGLSTAIPQSRTGNHRKAITTTTRAPITPKTLTLYEQLDEADSKMGGIGKGIENFKMMIGGKFNWEHLLSPAPLSISVLGDLMVLSSVTQDFSLEKGRPENGFQYMEWPKSFRATLVQISNTGYTTFLKAHTNMDQIRMHTMAVPAQMKEATNILFSRNPAVIERFLKLPLQRVLSSSQSCVKLSQEVVDSFENLISLTMEVIAVSTATKGISEVEQVNIIRQLKVANITLFAKKDLKERIENEHNEMRIMLEKSQEFYEKAMAEVPSGWETIAMNFIGGLANKCLRNLESSLADDDDSALQPKQNLTATDSADLILDDFGGKYPAKDIACLRKMRVLDAVISIQEIADRYDSRDDDFQSLNLASSGGFKPKEDFEKLKSISSLHFLCTPVEHSCNQTRYLLQTLRKHFKHEAKKLKPSPTQSMKTRPNTGNATADAEHDEEMDDNPSDNAKSSPYVDIAIRILDELKPLTHWIRKKASEGKQPIQSKSPLSPPSPKSGLPGDQAVSNARWKVTQASESLRLARDSAEKTRAQMIQVNNEYIHYMERALSLHIESVSYDEVIKMLSDGLNILSKLKGHWDKLNRFFITINNLIKITMDAELKTFVDKLENAKDVKILTDNIGLQLSANFIFESAMKANQASFFVYSMASLYVNVSDRYIMDSLASLDTMINLDPTKGNIDFLRRNLLAKCRQDSEEIIKLVLGEKEKLVESIDKREREIEETYAFLKKIPPAQIATTTTTRRPKLKMSIRKTATTAKPVLNEDYDYSGEDVDYADAIRYGGSDGLESGHRNPAEDLELAFEIPI